MQLPQYYIASAGKICYIISSPAGCQVSKVFCIGIHVHVCIGSVFDITISDDLPTCTLRTSLYFRELFQPLVYTLVLHVSL